VFREREGWAGTGFSRGKINRVKLSSVAVLRKQGLGGGLTVNGLYLFLPNRPGVLHWEKYSEMPNN